MRLERAALERLLRGERLGVDPPHGGDEVLTVLALAFPDGTAQVASQALGREAAEVQARIDALVTSRRAWLLPDGRVGVRPLRGARDDRTHALRRTIAAALPHACPGRLRLLAEAEASAAELALVLRAVLSDPTLSPGGAQSVIERALVVARVEGEPGVEEALLVELAAHALRQESGAAVELALYEVGRCEEGGADLAMAEQVLRVARAVFADDRPRVAELLAAIPPLTHEGLEVWRTAFGLWLRRGTAEEQAWLAGLAPWAQGAPDREGRVQGWWGDLRYRQGRFQQAARMHRAAAELKRDPTGRISSVFNLSAALLDAGELRDAEEAARAGVASAADLRLPRYEALLTWAARAARSRACVPLAADPALVEAASLIHRNTAAQVALGEAVIAWRTGDPALAHALAARALEVYSAARSPAAHALASLVHLLAAPGGPDPDDATRLVEQTRDLVATGIRLQVLGLLGRALFRTDWLLDARRLYQGAWSQAPETPLELVEAGHAAGLDLPTWSLP